MDCYYISKTMNEEKENEIEKARREVVRIEKSIQDLQEELSILKDEKRSIALRIARIHKSEKQQKTRKKNKEQTYDDWYDKHKDFGKSKPPDWL